jgi:hypothetical protein
VSQLPKPSAKSPSPNLPEKKYNLIAVRRDGLTYARCLEEAIATPELISNFDRLYGYNLGRRGAPLELAIDDATGFTEAGIIEFMNFVWEFVFTRIPIDEKAAKEFAAFLAKDEPPELPPTKEPAEC